MHTVSLHVDSKRPMSRRGATTQTNKGAHAAAEIHIHMDSADSQSASTIPGVGGYWTHEFLTSALGVHGGHKRRLCGVVFASKSVNTGKQARKAAEVN